MNLLKTWWIVFLVLLSIFIVGGYHLYSQQTEKMQKHKQNKEMIKKLEESQEEDTVLKTEEKKDIETLKSLAKQHGKWWFLHDIEDELGDEFKPLFRSIGQMKLEDKADYLYISRKVELEASYNELIRLFENLERERGFSIEELKISALPGNPERHHVSFTLSSVEIKKGFINELVGLEEKEEDLNLQVESLVLAPNWDSKQMLALENETIDPFVRQPRIKIVARSETPEILPPIDLSSKYRLEGIVDFPQYRIAIIGPDYILKEGDWLDNMQVVSIDDRRITLMDGEQEYFMSISGFATDTNRIKIDTMPEDPNVTVDDAIETMGQLTKSRTEEFLP
jgi:hypothetical protein